MHCLTPSSPAEAGLIRLLVVPNVSSDALGAVRREDLDLSDDTKARIKAYLDERKLAGTHVRVKAPAYQGLTIVATLAALPGYRRDHLRDDVLRALNRLLHPLTGGPDGTGWPIGRPVQRHELAAALAWTPGWTCHGKSCSTSTRPTPLRARAATGSTNCCSTPMRWCCRTGTRSR